MHCAEEFYQLLDGDGPAIVCGVSRYSSICSHLRYSLGGWWLVRQEIGGHTWVQSFLWYTTCALGMVCSSGASTCEWSALGGWRPK